MARLARTFLSSLRPAHVIATMALFVSLGGGYAAAFSGSGTLQKAGLTGVSTSFEDLRTLNEFGTLQVRCDTADDEMEYRLNNTTATEINVHVANENVPAFATGSVGPNAEGAIFGTNETATSIRMHLFKEGATSKSGVELVVSNLGPFANNCSTADVRVLALNTQE